MSSFLSVIIILFLKFITAPLGHQRKLKSIRKTLIIVERYMFSLYDPGNSKLWFKRNYELDTIEWLDNIPDDGNKTLWDIGANIGYYSFYGALRRNMQVLAFEPQAASYAFLNRSIESTRMDEKIVAYPLGFGNTKLGRLNQDDTGFGASMHGFDSEEDQFESSIAVKFRQGAIGFSVDDFVELFSPPLPTHVNLDVDGLEPDILRGGTKTFSAPSVQSMIVEVEGSPERQAEIVALMAELGFTAEPQAISAARRRKSPSAPPRYRNVVFRRPE